LAYGRKADWIWREIHMPKPISDLTRLASGPHFCARKWRPTLFIPFRRIDAFTV
jgi:hypothetical protein